MNFNRFKAPSRPFDSITFQEMVEKLSVTTKISPTLIQRYGLDALDNWATKTGNSLEQLFVMQNLERSENINDILEYFDAKLRPFITSQKILDKSRAIANVGYEVLFTT